MDREKKKTFFTFNASKNHNTSKNHSIFVISKYMQRKIVHLWNNLSFNPPVSRHFKLTASVLQAMIDNDCVGRKKHSQLSDLSALMVECLP